MSTEVVFSMHSLFPKTHGASNGVTIGVTIGSGRLVKFELSGKGQLRIKITKVSAHRNAWVLAGSSVGIKLTVIELM